MLTRMNYVLAALVVVVLVLNVVLGRDLTQPHYEFLPDMKHSQAYDAFSENPNFANGQTMQRPVPGTIARGESPLHYQATPEDALRAGEELHNLISANSDHDPLPESIARGEKIFKIYCSACHGASGNGDGAVTKHGFPPPASLLTGKSTQMKDGQLFHVITYGQGSMPSMAAQVGTTQRWDAINFVRSLQGKSTTSETPKANETAEPAGDRKENNE